jgi:uncharacterized membrane-anchored protein YhcB (DUF1043 family)
MWGFLFGFIVGIAAGMLAQANLRQTSHLDEQIAELRDRIDTVLQRSRDLLAETRTEVEALRQRVMRSNAPSATGTMGSSPRETPGATSE